MKNRSDMDRVLQVWMTDGPTAISDRVVEVVATRIGVQRQRRVWPLRGRTTVTTQIKLIAALAAALVVAVVGYNLLPLQPGVGTTAPTPTAVATPTPAATPAPVPEGGAMPPGTYFTHPLPAPDDGLTLFFTVPKGWYGFGSGTIFPDTAPGIALQFLDVTSVNSDLCQWQGPDGDISAGTTVNDLVAALVAQTAYEVSDPVDVSIGGYSGKRVDVVFPAELFEGTGSSAPDCDEGVARLWSTRGLGEISIYAQAPHERWQANILDVDGARLVIVAQDDPSQSAADRAAGQAIIDSMVIEP